MLIHDCSLSLQKNGSASTMLSGNTAFLQQQTPTSTTSIGIAQI